MRSFRILLLLLLAPGCSAFPHLNSHFNHEFVSEEDSAAGAGVAHAGEKLRATLAVDGERGNEKVLFFLALSGGGSRAAYLSGLTMLRLQTYFDDVDLLREVDVISSVSGGSLPGAYYALTRDDSLRPVGKLKALGTSDAAAKVSARLQVGADGRLRCSGRLADEEINRLRKALGSPPAANAVAQMCDQPLVGGRRSWDDATVGKLMTHDYLGTWLWSWLYPDNIVKYWFTGFDRADIMAQTLEDVLYDRPVIGTEYTFADLNPERPYLIVNATNATEQVTHDPMFPDIFSFGSVFTFTHDDFRARLNSDIARYSVARAVMASSAFPLVFPNVTLRDFRAGAHADCRRTPPPAACDDARYLHVFDGGNSDNLGLKSVKRALLELDVNGELEKYDRIVVLLVDAFTKPVGARRTEPDPRSLVSLFLDMNFIEAFDALLQANRARHIAEFQSASLRWSDGDCGRETQNLPPALCAKLMAPGRYPDGHLDLTQKLLFYHLGFDDVRDGELRAKVDRIPTSYKISQEDAESIRQAVDAVLPDDRAVQRVQPNPCMEEIRAIVLGTEKPAAEARGRCNEYDAVPLYPKK